MAPALQVCSQQRHSCTAAGPFAKHFGWQASCWWWARSHSQRAAAGGQWLRPRSARGAGTPPSMPAGPQDAHSGSARGKMAGEHTCRIRSRPGSSCLARPTSPVTCCLQQHTSWRSWQCQAWKSGSVAGAPHTGGPLQRVLADRASALQVQAQGARFLYVCCSRARLPGKGCCGEPGRICARAGLRRHPEAGVVIQDCCIPQPSPCPAAACSGHARSRRQ